MQWVSSAEGMASRSMARYTSLMTLLHRPQANCMFQTVLLTGASEGMGRCIALKLAAKGANIIAVARNADRLRQLIIDLEAVAKYPGSQRFTFMTADVATEGFGPSLVAEATAWNNDSVPDMCWCVAGLATPGFFAETPLSAFRHNTNVNLFGQAEMAHAFLRAWTGPDAPTAAQHGRGTRQLILTSTTACFWTVPGYSPYAPAKMAVRCLADILSQEVLLYPDYDIRVRIVFPGTMTSPGLDRENQSKPEITHMIESVDPVQTPEHATDVAFKGLEDGQYAVSLAWLGHIMKWLNYAGSLRNNYLIDTIMAMTIPLVASILLFADQLPTLKKYGQKYKHPRDHPIPGRK